MVDSCNPRDSIRGLLNKENESLKVQKRKLHAAITGEFAGHSESESLVDALLYASDLCWEK